MDNTVSAFDASDGTELCDQPVSLGSVSKPKVCGVGFGGVTGVVTYETPRVHRRASGAVGPQIPRGVARRRKKPKTLAGDRAYGVPPGAGPAGVPAPSR